MSYLERKYPRAVPGPDCRLHFQAGDFACAGLALSTVGLGGCSFALPAHLADAVKDGRGGWVDEIVTIAGVQLRNESWHAKFYGATDWID